jgi:hypothetical protein
MQQINRDGLWAIVAVIALLILGVHLQSRGWVVNVDRTGTQEIKAQ